MKDEWKMQSHTWGLSQASLCLSKDSGSASDLTVPASLLLDRDGGVIPLI